MGTRKRRGEIQGPIWTDEQGDQIRSSLLELYEDIVLADTSLAATRGLDDKIWNLVFYPRIEELRNAYRKGNDPTQRQPIEIELNRQMDLAVFFYQTLVLTLRAQGGKSVDEYPISSQFLAGITSDFLAFHRYIYLLEEINVGHALKMQQAVTEGVWNMMAGQAGNEALHSWFRKAMVILVCSYNDLNLRFGATDNPSTRQKIRIAQTLTLTFLFELASLILGYLNSRSHEAGHEEDSAEQSDPALELLAPLAILCIWLEMDSGALEQYQMYGKTVAESQTLQERLLSFLRRLAIIVNNVSTFADTDGSDESVPEDEELLCLPSLRLYFAGLDPTSLCRAFGGKASSGRQRYTVRASRIARFGKRLAEDDKFDLFRFDEREGRFFVLDEEAKRKGMHKVMRVLATERLRDQVAALEQSVNALKDASRPIAVLDLDCYVNHLPKVKKWLMSRKCILVVASDVIDGLDRIKKGTELHNAHARDAIRYLEERFKYRSDSLVAQKHHETLKPWSSSGLFKIPSPNNTTLPPPRDLDPMSMDWEQETQQQSIFVPKGYREIVG
ncbi:Protein smg5, partial [Rhizophlyctis rosea]